MELGVAAAGFLGLVFAWMILPPTPPKELRAVEPTWQMAEDTAA
jgi:hypothetical protein